MISSHQKLTDKVQEIGFTLTIRKHKNQWDNIFTIIDKETEIFSTVHENSIGAWIAGYKHFCKEAWEV